MPNLFMNVQSWAQVNFFLVMLPEKPALPRAENFGYMVESFSELAPILEKYEARLVIEGWPGSGRALLHAGRLPLFVCGGAVQGDGRQL